MPILASLAALAVEVGFEDIGFTVQQIRRFNPKDKLTDLRVDINQLSELKDSIVTKGLPSVKCSMDSSFLGGIKISSTFGKIIDIVSSSANNIPGKSQVLSEFLGRAFSGPRKRRTRKRPKKNE